MLVILDLNRQTQKQLQEIARQERRTVSDQVAFYIERALPTNARPPKDGTPEEAAHAVTPA